MATGRVPDSGPTIASGELLRASQLQKDLAGGEVVVKAIAALDEGRWTSTLAALPICSAEPCAVDCSPNRSGTLDSRPRRDDAAAAPGRLTGMHVPALEGWLLGSQAHAHLAYTWLGVTGTSGWTLSIIVGLLCLVTLPGRE